MYCVSNVVLGDFHGQLRMFSELLKGSTHVAGDVPLMRDIARVIHVGFEFIEAYALQPLLYPLSFLE